MTEIIAALCVCGFVYVIKESLIGAPLDEWEEREAE